MTLTPDQIRAARALLNISQDELAKGSGVAVSTIRQFELGLTTTLQQKTEAALQIFLGEKIEFIGTRGVALREATILVLEGETVIAQMFEDIHVHMRGHENTEILFLCGTTPCLFSPELKGYRTMLQTAGLTYRSICHKEGEPSYVRVAPANFTPLPLQVVYGTTIAQMISSDRILLIRSPMLASGLRQTFEMLWSAVPSPDATSESDTELQEEALRA